MNTNYNKFKSSTKKSYAVQAYHRPAHLFGNNANLHHLKLVKNLLDAHRAKAESLEFRKKTLEHQNRINYKNELDRIRRTLEATRAYKPHERLNETLLKREKDLEKLIKDAV